MSKRIEYQNKVLKVICQFYHLSMLNTYQTEATIEDMNFIRCTKNQQQVTADLLKQYQKEFKGRTLAVTWNYLRDSMSSYLPQPNPITIIRE